jgi:HlyD family secretion protein
MEIPPRSDAALHRAVIARHGMAGYATIALFFGTGVAWACLASISGAVIAPAQVVAETNLKKVQHPQGGIVSELRVREGDAVRAGDVVLRLDDTLTRTSLEIHARQTDELLVRLARLEAERDLAGAIRLPMQLAARAGEVDLRGVLQAEQRLMDARASSRAGLRAQLDKRIAQLRADLKGANGQAQAKARESDALLRELDGVRSLQRRNLVPLSRLTALDREWNSVEAQRASISGQIAQTEQKILETDLQIRQIAEDLQSEVLRDIRETQARLAEVTQRRIAAEDQFRRVELRAPVDGFVHQLAVHTVGGVINPGEAAMAIVPSRDQLHLEARIAPSDYDQLHIDQPVTLRLHAFNQRTTPELKGAIVRLAADVSRDPVSGAAQYVVRIALPPTELSRIAPLELKPGMQGDAFIATPERSPASFLLKPFYDQVARAFRER